uniref:response regulator n=1 Tax=Vaginimicrobium propionicum TaxID=1871034 RepID=UPI0009703ACC|nr:response regulator [Vaginimicrobium propionicum]
MSASETQPTRGVDKLRVIVYSSDRTVRQSIKTALGSKVSADLPELDYYDFATQPALMKALDEEAFDLAILDGEAVPGGMGISHQMRDEIKDPPPVVLLVARQDDSWMAAWSKAEMIVPYPIDPLNFPKAVAKALRDDRAGRITILSSDRVDPGTSSRHVKPKD